MTQDTRLLVAISFVTDLPGPYDDFVLDHTIRTEILDFLKRYPILQRSVVKVETTPNAEWKNGNQHAGVMVFTFFYNPLTGEPQTFSLPLVYTGYEGESDTAMVRSSLNNSEVVQAAITAREVLKGCIEAIGI